MKDRNNSDDGDDDNDNDIAAPEQNNEKDSFGNAVEENEVDYSLPVCADAEDHKFANCRELQKFDNCKQHREKMKYYCPITCRLCRGPMPLEIGNSKAHSPVACFYSKYGCCADQITVAQGPEGLGCPENCYDKDDKKLCGFFARAGYCEWYKETLLERCPRGCGFCRPKEETECKNKWSDQRCQFLSYYRMCESPNQSLRERVGEHCKKTCGKCTENIPAIDAVASSCVQNGDCCWDKSTPKHHGCPKCKNILSANFCNRFRRDCFDNEKIQGVQIRTLCSRTCGLCHSNLCHDDIIRAPQCKVWANQGECTRNKKIMQQYCRKTCGFCSMRATDKREMHFQRARS